MNRMPIGLTLVAIVLAGLLSAGALAPPAAQDLRLPPSFDGAAALHHVERLVAIGPRPAGSTGAARARSYIVDELKRAGVSAKVESFDAVTPHGRLPMANVLAVIPGRRQDVILIAGHYDTKWFRDISFVGANDGGSSAALLIELARRLRERPREYTYWVAWFDGEEARESWTATDSLYGSRRMASELGKSRRLPSAVIVAAVVPKSRGRLSSGACTSNGGMASNGTSSSMPGHERRRASKRGGQRSTTRPPRSFTRGA